MAAWWKRLIYSFVSTVFGAGLCGAAAAANVVISNAHGHLSTMGLWTEILAFDPWVILLSLFGWLLALPLILLVRNVRGWRFWMWWAVGICIGPAIIEVVNWIAAMKGFSLAGIPGGLNTALWLSGAISGLSSLLYLLIIRRSQVPESLPESAALV